MFGFLNICVKRFQGLYTDLLRARDGDWGLPIGERLDEGWCRKGRWKLVQYPGWRVWYDQQEGIGNRTEQATQAGECGTIYREE